MSIGILTIYSSLIPAVCGLVVVRKLNAPYRAFFIFCIVTVFTEFWSLVLAATRTNNLFIIQAHSLMDFIIYTYLFSEFYKWEPFINKIQYLGIILFCFFSICYSMTGDNIMRFYSIPISILCIWLCFWSGLTIYKLLEQDNFGLFRSDSLIITGVFIYFSVNFFIFSFYDYSKYVRKLPIELYSFHGLVNIFTNIIFGAAFLCLKKSIR